MISIKDIQELFGRRAAKAALVIILLSFAGFFIVDIFTDNTITNRIRNYFRSPIVVNHLYMYQPPPEPFSISEANARVIDSITIRVPLRIVNKSNQIIFIESIKIQWRCLDNFSDFDKYDEITSGYPAPSNEGSPNTRTFGVLLKGYEGCLLEGHPVTGVRYKDERELEDDGLSGFNKGRAYIYFPLKLNPYEEVLSSFYFSLDIVAKDGRSLRFAFQREEQKEIFIKLMPIFFGATSVQNLANPVLVTIGTNQGVFEVREIFRTLFIGTELILPEKEVKPDVENKMRQPKQ